MSEVRSKIAPYGFKDLFVQILALLLCYGGYQVVRGFSDRSTGQAFENANHIISLERSLGVFWEPWFQQRVGLDSLLIQAANWTYLNSHYLVSSGVLLWIYRCHRSFFPLLRNSFLLAMILALVGYALFPVAPPRLVSGLGLQDTLAVASGVSAQEQQGSALLNMYAAVPSMHVCFSLLVSVALIKKAKTRIRRGAGWCYPLIVCSAVVLTANHYLFDVLVGALVAICSWAVASRLEAQKRSNFLNFGIS